MTYYSKKILGNITSIFGLIIGLGVTIITYIGNNEGLITLFVGHTPSENGAVFSGPIIHDQIEYLLTRSYGIEFGIGFYLMVIGLFIMLLSLFFPHNSEFKSFD